jgi:hypothetical protein
MSEDLKQQLQKLWDVKNESYTRESLVFDSNQKRLVHDGLSKKDAICDSKTGWQTAPD